MLLTTCICFDKCVHRESSKLKYRENVEGRTAFSHNERASSHGCNEIQIKYLII